MTAIDRCVEEGDDDDDEEANEVDLVDASRRGDARSIREEDAKVDAKVEEVEEEVEEEEEVADACDASATVRRRTHSYMICVRNAAAKMSGSTGLADCATDGVTDCVREPAGTSVKRTGSVRKGSGSSRNESMRERTGRNRLNEDKEENKDRP